MLSYNLLIQLPGILKRFAPNHGQFTGAPAVPKLPHIRLKSTEPTNPSLFQSARRSVVPPNAFFRILKSTELTRLSLFASPAPIKPISTWVVPPPRVRLPEVAR